MSKTKVLTRSWAIAIPEFPVEQTVAAVYAEKLLDVAVASSKQSLQETMDALERIRLDLMSKASEYESQSKGFHRSAFYKGKMAGYLEMIETLIEEINTYQKRLEANANNDGRQDD